MGGVLHLVQRGGACAVVSAGSYLIDRDKGITNAVGHLLHRSGSRHMAILAVKHGTTVA